MDTDTLVTSAFLAIIGVSVLCLAIAGLLNAVRERKITPEQVSVSFWLVLVTGIIVFTATYGATK